MKTTCNLSKDYEKLWVMLKQGYAFVGFVDYNPHDNIYRDVCRIKMNSNNEISVSCRGCSYFDEFYTKIFDDFNGQCLSVNLEFII